MKNLLAEIPEEDKDSNFGDYGDESDEGEGEESDEDDWWKYQSVVKDFGLGKCCWWWDIVSYCLFREQLT